MEENRQNTAALLTDCCKKMGVPLTEGQAGQFMAYLALLLEWNEKMNLTAITEEREIVIKHFADSLSLAPAVKEGALSVIDVGTGAGFPGLPLKIARPEIRLTLLDSLQKRIGFLEEVTARLGLEDVSCVHSRAEDGGQNPAYREQFDLCVSRAVAALPVLLEYCLPFVRVGGYFVALKGPDAENELAESGVALETLGGRLTELRDVEIPGADLSHTLVFIEKTAPTPKQYPRKAGKIGKKPLL